MPVEMKKALPISDEDFKKRSAAFLTEVRLESDRGLVLIAAAMLEENLELLLRSFMRKNKKIEDKVLRPLFCSDGPLGSFAAKTRICYAMKLIDDATFDDLSNIRYIRNDFAHSYAEAKLEVGSVRHRIGNLRVGKMFEEFFDKSSDVYFEMDEKGERTIPVSEEKRRFIISAVILAAVLEGAARAFRKRQEM